MAQFLAEITERRVTHPDPDPVDFPDFPLPSTEPDPWDNPQEFGADILREPSGSQSVPRLYTRSDGVGLIYVGRINWLYGLAGVGKTDQACLIAREALDNGRRVLFWDFENSRPDLWERLAKIGVKPDHPRLLYAYGMALRATLAAQAMRRGDLVIIDSAERSGAPADANGNAFAAWWALCVSPFVGRTVIVVDHVPKNEEGRARGPKGAGEKLNRLTGAALLVTGTPAGRPDPDNPNRTPTDGRLTLTCEKDRPGLIGLGPCATVTQTWAGQPDGWEYAVTVSPHETDPDRQVTDLAADILEFLADHPGSSTNAIYRAVGGDRNKTLAAIRRLIDKGDVTTKPGPRRATLHWLTESADATE